MRNYKLIIVMLILGLTLLQGTAMAEMIQGTIASLDLAASMLTITRISPSTGAEESLEVALSPEVTLKGLGSLEELKTGDEVTVEASQDESGKFQATAIEVSKPSEGPKLR
ncbi:MAG: hypothetical protein HY584_04575 [Candidatus Omnitrophica bacterium]|nr:hypothetical protein [Candidatus Omnitrophota bacterium]